MPIWFLVLGAVIAALNFLVAIAAAMFGDAFKATVFALIGLMIVNKIRHDLSERRRRAPKPPLQDDE